MAGCTYPSILKSSDFPSDIKQRVERLLSACGGKSLGSYTESQGIITIREDIANYIQERDDYPANPSDIYLCNGASDGIKTVIKLLMNTDPEKPSGIVSRLQTKITNKYSIKIQPELFIWMSNIWTCNSGSVYPNIAKSDFR